MTQDIVVVEEAWSKDEAEAMGHRRFRGMEIPAPHVDPVEPFHDSAQWANHVLPTLRCMAGFRDSGHGTWQIGGEIALIEDGDESDQPADAVKMQAGNYLGELVDAWHQGAYRAVEQAGSEVDQ